MLVARQLLSPSRVRLATVIAGDDKTKIIQFRDPDRSVLGLAGRVHQGIPPSYISTVYFETGFISMPWEKPL